MREVDALNALVNGQAQPLPVHEKAKNPESLRFQAVDTDLTENISSPVPWKVNLIALDFSSNDLKTYRIVIVDKVQGVSYLWKVDADTDIKNVVITEELNLTEDQKLKIRTIGVTTGNTVSVLVNREER